MYLELVLFCPQLKWLLAFQGNVYFLLQTKILKNIGYEKPWIFTCSTSHHKLMIKKGSITVTFIAAEQLLNTTWQFLHCKTRDVLTGAWVMRGCKCKWFSLSLSLSGSVAHEEAWKLQKCGFNLACRAHS